MKKRITLLCTLASLGSTQAFVTYSADISVFADGDFANPIQLSTLISVSEVPDASVSPFGATSFEIESITFEGDFSQTFTALNNPLFNLSIGEEFGEFLFDATIPLPQGILGTTEDLFLNTGFLTLFDPPVPAPLTSFEATDFEVFFGDSAAFGGEITGGGSFILAVSDLPAFVDGTLGTPVFFDPSFGLFNNLTVVPEPSSLLLGVVAMGFSMSRRRRTC